MKYCQGTKCHEYRTRDRIRGTKGSKSYQTRRRSQFYYGKGNFCSLNCQNDWLEQNIENALTHFGRTTEAKRIECDNAWYKDYKYNYDNGRSHYQHYFINDLLGKKIPITEQQYNSEELITPNNLSTQ